MSESTAKKKAKPVKKPDDGKSSVQVRIDRGVLKRARECSKEMNLDLDMIFEVGVARGVMIAESGDADNQKLYVSESSVETIITNILDIPGLNEGPLLEAEAFCEKRGWTIPFLMNRALIHELERCK